MIIYFFKRKRPISIEFFFLSKKAGWLKLFSFTVLDISNPKFSNLSMLRYCVES